MAVVYLLNTIAMKNNNRNIAILIVSLLTIYSLVAGYFVHSDYVFSLEKSIKTSDSYCHSKSQQISTYINGYVATASAAAEMLSSAKEKYGFNMMPFCEQSLKNICIQNPNIASITITWEYAAVNPEWSKPVGRLQMKAFMIDGRPRVLRDTVDLEGEYVSESYYQMKNGSMHHIHKPRDNISRLPAAGRIDAMLLYIHQNIAEWRLYRNGDTGAASKGNRRNAA